MSRHFKIISCGWCAGPWIRGCVESIESQQYTDYDVCIIDDASGDAELSAFITQKCEERGWKYILRDERMGAARNQWDGVHLMVPDQDDVVIFLDSDDQFAHRFVLDRLVEAYADGTKLTYGSYEPVPPSSTCNPAVACPLEVIVAGDYRHYGLHGYGIFWNHLRTVKYELFSQLTEVDFKDQYGQWLKSAVDSAVMFPCLELSRGAFKFLPETLVLYNSENPLSDWRLQPNQCDQDHVWILTRPRKC